MRIIAIVSGKGGSGKSSAASNLGAELAAMGQRVALVDLDPQGALGAALGLDAPGAEVATVAEVLSRRREFDQLARVAERLELAPAGRGLAAVETELAADPVGVHVLAETLRATSRRYDVAILDTPPHLGVLTASALVAAHQVLIPAAAEFLGLRMLPATLEAVAKVRRINKRLALLGVLPTMVTRTRHAAEVRAEFPALLKDFPGARVFDGIPRRVAVAEASAAGRPLLEVAPHSDARAAYHQLAKELTR